MDGNQQPDEFMPFNGPPDITYRPFAARLPRWPFSPAPTVANWFKTTVNPLVWKLIDDYTVPMSRSDAAFGQRLIEDGLDVDLYPWLAIDDFHVSNPEQALQLYGPIVLSVPAFWQRVFELIVSGRWKDRRQAAVILEKATSGLKLPRGVSDEIRPLVVTNMAMGRRKALGGNDHRLALASNLATSLKIAVLRESGLSLRKAKALSKKQRGTSEIACSRSWGHVTNYLNLLETSRRLAWAARESYGDTLAPIQVVIRSLKEAIEWLKEEDSP